MMIVTDSRIESRWNWYCSRSQRCVSNGLRDPRAKQYRSSKHSDYRSSAIRTFEACRQHLSLSSFASHRNPMGTFNAHTASCGGAVQSNPFLAHRSRAGYPHFLAHRYRPRRRAKNALHNAAGGIIVGPVPVSVIKQEVNWSKSSSYWDMSLCRRPSDTSGANSASTTRLMIGLGSSRIRQDSRGIRLTCRHFEPNPAAHI